MTDVVTVPHGPVEELVEDRDSTQQIRESQEEDDDEEDTDTDDGAVGEDEDADGSLIIIIINYLIYIEACFLKRFSFTELTKQNAIVIQIIRKAFRE